MLVDHEKNALCDSYIVQFIHDATENYYEGGTYACRYCNNIKFPLYVLKVLMFCLFFSASYSALRFSRARRVCHFEKK